MVSRDHWTWLDAYKPRRRSYQEIPGWLEVIVSSLESPFPMITHCQASPRALGRLSENVSALAHSAGNRVSYIHQLAPFSIRMLRMQESSVLGPAAMMIA
jgi:hypothetical protein